MGGLFGGGIFGGNRGNNTQSSGGSWLGNMLRSDAADVPGINTYQHGVDPAIAAAKNIWGDPAVTAAENIWGPSGDPGLFDVGGALYSPYNGYVDRMANFEGYKTPQMIYGASKRYAGDNNTRMVVKDQK